MQNYQSQFPPYTYVGNTYEAVGRMCGIDTMAGGIFDIGQDKKHLGEFQKSIATNFGSWLNLFVTPASGKGHHHSQIDESLYFFLPDNIYNSLPKNVIDKFNDADHCFFRINGQTDNAIKTGDLFKLVYDTITTTIGMSPIKFWQRFFGVNGIAGFNRNSRYGNYAYRIGAFEEQGNPYTDPSDPGQQLSEDPTQPNDPASQSQHDPKVKSLEDLIDATGAYFGLPPGAIQQALNTFTPGLVQSPSPATFAFSLQDFANTPYPKDKTLFAAQQQQTTPGQQQQQTPEAHTTNLLIPIGAGVLLIMLLKK